MCSHMYVCVSIPLCLCCCLWHSSVCVCLDSIQSNPLTPQHTYPLTYIRTAGNPDAYSQTEEQVADNLYVFLQEFYALYPELLARGLYVMGERWVCAIITMLGKGGGC